MLTSAGLATGHTYQNKLKTPEKSYNYYRYRKKKLKFTIRSIRSPFINCAYKRRNSRKNVCNRIHGRRKSLEYNEKYQLENGCVVLLFDARQERPE